MQADAVLRAAANDTTGGLADNFSAGANAALGIGGSGDLGQRYRSNLLQEMKRDNYDAKYRPVAHAIGRSLGTVLNALSLAEAGVGVADALPSVAKGGLGENLSWLKTRLSGDYPADLQVRTPLSRGYTVVDHVTAKGVPVEAKFGYNTTLRGPQQRAARELPGYRIDWWTPNHIGLGAGAAGGLWGLLSPDPAHFQPPPM